MAELFSVKPLRGSFERLRFEVLSVKLVMGLSPETGISTADNGGSKRRAGGPTSKEVDDIFEK